MADMQRTSFSLVAGERKYLKVMDTQLERAPPLVLSRGEAEASLAKLRHRFKTPLSFDRQTDPNPRVSYLTRRVA
jgi:hypothetical protein